MSRWLAALVCLLLLSACKSDRRAVVVLTAASLARAFAELEQQIERDHPQLDVQLEIGGSQALCRKLVELGGRADVLAVADFRTIDTICRPSHARFNIHFTTNAIVLAHMEHSRHTDRITADNWPEILMRPGVRLGLVDPDLAPIGYRTLLVWKLAELELGRDKTGGADLAGRLRARVAREHVAPHESELMQLLQSRTVDYAFVYRSTAEEHNLKVTTLPDSYNLGSVDNADGYRRATLKVEMKRGQGRSMNGSPVVYGVTIPARPLNAAGAELFVRTLLDAGGRRVLRRTGFRPMVPARCAERAQLPPSLRLLVR